MVWPKITEVLVSDREEILMPVIASQLQLFKIQPEALWRHAMVSCESFAETATEVIWAIDLHSPRTKCFPLGNRS